MFFSLILFFIYDFTVDFVFEYEMFPDSGLFEKEKAAAGYATANKYLISFFYRQTGANRGNITYSALTILLNAIAIFYYLSFCFRSVYLSPANGDGLCLLFYHMHMAAFCQQLLLILIIISQPHNHIFQGWKFRRGHFTKF